VSEDEVVRRLLDIYKKYDRIAKRARAKIDFIDGLKRQLYRTVKKEEKSLEYDKFKKDIHNFRSAIIDHEIRKNQYDEKTLKFLEDIFYPDLVNTLDEVRKSNNLKEKEREEIENELEKLVKRTKRLSAKSKNGY
jgi:hypothetical protein